MQLKVRVRMHSCMDTHAQAVRRPAHAFRRPLGVLMYDSCKKKPCMRLYFGSFARARARCFHANANAGLGWPEFLLFLATMGRGVVGMVLRDHPSGVARPGDEVWFFVPPYKASEVRNLGQGRLSTHCPSQHCCPRWRTLPDVSLMH